MITKDQKASYRGFLWHGVFLALTVTFTEVNTVLPAMVIQVGGSEIHIGIITAIMMGFPLISQLLFAPFVQSANRKKPFLIGGLYARMISLFGIGLLLGYTGSLSAVTVLAFIYLGLTVFTLSGAFAGISYVSLIGLSIPDSLRKQFFLRKQVFWSLGVFCSGLLTRYVLTGLEGALRYRVLFFLASLMLAAGSIGFWMIREPRVIGTDRPQESLAVILKSIGGILREDRTFRHYCVAVNLLTLSIAVIPFYVPALIRHFSLNSDFIGTIVLLQMGGMVLSNLLWPGIIEPLGFKGLLKIQAAGSFLIPLFLAVSLFLSQGRWILYCVFPMEGALAGAHKMSGEAVLVQISHKEKRPLYSGIYGALNLASALAPLLLGVLLKKISFPVLFPAVGLLSLLSFPFISSMVCPVDTERARRDMIGNR